MKYLFCLLIVFLLLTRFALLSILPASLTHDETVYAANSAAYVIQGSGLGKLHFPWQLSPIHPAYAELPATIMSLGFFITNNALLATHFTSAVMGVLLPFFFGWLLWGIWHDKKLAMVGIIVAAASPLWWQFSRLSYDTFYSTFFYFAGGAIYVNLSKKKKWFSLPIFLLGFFQYQGLKILLPAWIGLLWLLTNFPIINFQNIVHLWQQCKKKLLQTKGQIFLFSIIFTLFYSFILLPKQNTNQRLHDTIFFNGEVMASHVNLERRLSLNSKYQQYVANKLTLTGFLMIDKFIGAFNPNLLFRMGEPNASGFAVWTHGLFYLVDFWLILAGGFYLLHRKKTRMSAILLIASIIIFNIPNLINTASQWFMMRSFLSYSILLILVSWGIRFFWNYQLGRISVAGLYLLSVLYFTYQYFYRYPVTHLDAGTFDERVVSRYADLATVNQANKKIVIHTDTPDMTFYNYLLYEQKINHENIEQINQTVLKNIDKPIRSYQLGNITVTNNCVDVLNEPLIAWKVGHNFCQPQIDPNDEATQKLVIQLEKMQTAVKKNRITIPAVLDSGEAYKIYGDQLCQQFELQRFVSLKNYAQLRLRQLSANQFCQQWITDLKSLEK